MLFLNKYGAVTDTDKLQIIFKKLGNRSIKNTVNLKPITAATHKEIGDFPKIYTELFQTHEFGNPEHTQELPPLRDEDKQYRILLDHNRLHEFGLGTTLMYKIPDTVLQSLQELVNKWVTAGIAEPCSGYLACPTIAVKKPNGGIRWVQNL